MNYLICNHCNYKNQVNTERIVFCKACGKKIENNYIDWKKTVHDTSFNIYLSKETTENATQIKKAENKKQGVRIFLIDLRCIYKLKVNRDFKVFFFTTAAQLILFFFLVNDSFDNNEPLDSSDVSFLNEVKWKSYPIAPNIKITLPFKPTISKSILPGHVHFSLSDDICFRSEYRKRFSVTIEEFTSYQGIYMGNQYLISLKDEYLKNVNTQITSTSAVANFKIKEFNTFAQYGAFILDDTKYEYENYTLIYEHKTIKVIICYLSENKLLRKYSDIVIESLQQNVR